MTKNELFNEMFKESINFSKDNNIENEIDKTLTESISEENESIDPKIQKMLNKLISEEVIARDTYMGCIIASKEEEHSNFKNLFIKIAADEIEDHFKSLYCWAKQFNYSIPYKTSDYTKYASRSSTSILNNLKPNKEALYYISEAIKSEEDAIKSYTVAMEYEDIPYELNSILLKILEDEKEHLQELNTLKLALEANATLYLY